MRPDHLDSSEPIDPDTAPEPPTPGPTPRQASLLTAIAAGGAIGACARYGATLLWPTTPGTFPWTTFGINITGCALMGILMVLITERFTVHPLTRPFLGTGVLGGYTTFSTYAIDGLQLFSSDRPAIASIYLATTLTAAMIAVWGAAALTRRIIPTRPDQGTHT